MQQKEPHTNYVSYEKRNRLRSRKSLDASRMQDHCRVEIWSRRYPGTPSSFIHKRGNAAWQSFAENGYRKPIASTLAAETFPLRRMYLSLLYTLSAILYRQPRKLSGRDSQRLPWPSLGPPSKRQCLESDTRLEMNAIKSKNCDIESWVQ